MNSTIPIQVSDFEEIAKCFYQNTLESEKSRELIQSLSDQPYSLYIFHTLFTDSTSQEAKYLCLSAIASKIKSQWNLFSEQQKSQLKSFYFDLVREWPTKGLNIQVLRQLDSVLIQILFEEWPENWPSFISDIIAISNENPMTMLNCVYFFGSFSEQIRHSKLIASKKRQLILALYQNFQIIYNFLRFAFLQENNMEEIKIESLITLSQYLEWVDLKFVEDDKIFDFFFSDLMPYPHFRIPILKCLSSIVSRERATANPLIVTLFNQFICLLSNDSTMLIDKELVPSLVNILIKFVTLDRCALMPNDTVIQWMIEYTKIVDEELFAQIVDMWHYLAKVFICDTQMLPFSNCFLFPLQQSLCGRMSKPPEYDGDKELFDKMSETLLILFRVHKDEILGAIVEKINGPNYDEQMLPIIYSIGAISGVCGENEEKAFLSIIIESLLRFMQNNDEFSPQITAAFMYIVSLYPRYLANNLPILEITLSKHFEYFVSGNQFAQFVAVKTFINLTKSCGKLIVDNGYSNQIFEQIDVLLQKIPPFLHQSFFISLKYIVKNCRDEAERQKMIVVLLNHANRIDIITELISIVGNDFQQSIEQIIQNIINDFKNTQNELERHQLYELFQEFLKSFPQSSCIPTLVNEVYSDFGKFHSFEAFEFFSILIKEGNVDLVPYLFNNFLAPTFEHISKTFTEYPEIRLPFYKLIRSIFEYFFQIPREMFNCLFHYCFYGMLHPQTDISELSFNCVSTVLLQLDSNNDLNVINDFYSTFYFELISQFFDVMFDGLHSFLFSQVTQSLYHLLQIAAAGKLNFLDVTKIFDFVFQKLVSTFPNLTQDELRCISGEIINGAQSCEKLRQVINDFIIVSRQINLSDGNILSFDIDEEQAD